MTASMLLTISAVLPSRMPPSRLPAHRLHAGSSATAIVPLRTAVELSYLKLSDPALRAITDFDREPAFTVEEDTEIDGAVDDMFRFGVRALLTTRDGRVTGLVTSHDVQAKRPRQLITRTEGLRREEVRVCDILTPWSELPLVTFEVLQEARVSDLLELFDSTARTHLIIVEHSEGSARVRGVVSRTRLQRQLERPI
jgi:CBS domain-containing protein